MWGLELLRVLFSKKQLRDVGRNLCVHISPDELFSPKTAEDFPFSHFERNTLEGY